MTVRFLIFAIYLAVLVAVAWRNIDLTDRQVELTIERESERLGKEAKRVQHVAQTGPKEGEGAAEKTFRNRVQIQSPADNTVREFAAVLREEADRTAGEAAKWREQERLDGKRKGVELRRQANSLRNLAHSLEEQLQESKRHADRAAQDLEALFQSGLAALEDALGPHHPNVALGCHGLADLYVDNGRYDEAEALLQRALIIEEKSLGEDHETVATTLEVYADLLRKGGREVEAEHLQARAAAIWEKHGSRSPAGSTLRSWLPE